MDECSSQSGIEAVEAEQILRKIIADFEKLDRAIDSAISLMGAEGRAKEIRALERAREAVRKGTALARSKVLPE